MTGHNQVVIVIPARYGSERFPGKPLALLWGRPMIEHVYRRAAGVEGVARVIVATDDERIRQAVVGFGGEARMTWSGHASGTDRVAEVARELKAELVVNVQGDEPLIEPDHIARAIAPLRADATVPMGTLVAPLAPDELRDPNVVKAVVDRAGFALYFSRAPIGAGLRGDLLSAHRHVGLYVFRRDFLLTFTLLEPTPLEQAERLEQLRALEHGYRIRCTPVERASIGVDTKSELERLNASLP